MVENRLKKCCMDCPNRKTYMDEANMLSDDKVVSVITTIGCEHESVCKEYIESVQYIGNKEELKNGQKISMVLYKGYLPLAAQGILEYWRRKHEFDNVPIPLTGTGFNISVSDLDARTAEDAIMGRTLYEVILKGELI